MNHDQSFPAAGTYSLSALPEPYQTAFRQGRAHHLPGQFLPAQIDWFCQIFMLPLMLLYALPSATLVSTLIIQAIRQPTSYSRFFQKVMQQTPTQIGITLLLLLLIAVLLGVCALQAGDMAQSFYRTWEGHRVRQQGGNAYGLVLLPHGIVGRLVDNLAGHNCLWLPRQAIAEIAWQRMREEGAKRSRWVNRTRICYVSESGDRRWLTLPGNIVQLGSAVGEAWADRALYETLENWWKQP